MLAEKNLRKELINAVERKYGSTEVEYKRGMIFWCDLGTISNGERDCEQRGLRPCIIIQNDIGNKYSPTVIVAAITSQINKAKYPTHVEISSKKYDLSKDSIVLAEQTRTLDKKKVGDYIGMLDEIDMQRLNKAVGISIGLVEVQKQINNNNVTNIKEVKIATEIGKELDLYDTVIKKWIDNGKSINLIKEICQERQDKLGELRRLCDKYNLNINKFYQDYNQTSQQKVKVKSC